MKYRDILFTTASAFVAMAAAGPSAAATTAVQIGSSGLTFASSAVQCAAHPLTAELKPMVKAGLFNPKRNATAAVLLNRSVVANVTAADPAADVWLADGANSVVVAISRKTADTFVFNVAHDTCAVPDTSGNTISADGTLEYAASGKSYATTTPGCALSPTTGQPQPYVHLFDNGSYLLNVSVNGVPLTQLSALKPHTPVFLGAGRNVIAAANAGLSTDYYIRDGGVGGCTLP